MKTSLKRLEDTLKLTQQPTQSTNHATRLMPTMENVKRTNVRKKNAKLRSAMTKSAMKKSVMDKKTIKKEPKFVIKIKLTKGNVNKKNVKKNVKHKNATTKSAIRRNVMGKSPMLITKKPISTMKNTMYITRQPRKPNISVSVRREPASVKKIVVKMVAKEDANVKQHVVNLKRLSAKKNAKLSSARNNANRNVRLTNAMMQLRINVIRPKRIKQKTILIAPKDMKQSMPTKFLKSVIITRKLTKMHIAKPTKMLTKMRIAKATKMLISKDTNKIMGTLKRNRRKKRRRKCED